MSVSSEFKAASPVQALLMPDTLEPDNPLWHFALSLWQGPGIQESCLALQQQGWNVTQILCAGWLAVSGRTYSGSEDTKVTEWRNRVTGALRTARQAIPKTDDRCSGLRQSIASLELEAERVELALAWQTLNHQPRETSPMQGRETLIQSNLQAAGPPAGVSQQAAPHLATLADTLASLAKGEAQS